MIFFSYCLQSLQLSLDVSIQADTSFIYREGQEYSISPFLYAGNYFVTTGSISLIENFHIKKS